MCHWFKHNFLLLLLLLAFAAISCSHLNLAVFATIIVVRASIWLQFVTLRMI